MWKLYLNINAASYNLSNSGFIPRPEDAAHPVSLQSHWSWNAIPAHNWLHVLWRHDTSTTKGSNRDIPKIEFVYTRYSLNEKPGHRLTLQGTRRKLYHFHSYCLSVYEKFPNVGTSSFMWEILPHCKQKLKASSFWEAVLPRGNGVSVFTVLQSHESTELSCYSRSKPDSPQCRRSFILFIPRPSCNTQWH